MSTTGIELKTRRRALAEAVELVSSMRFAISLLVILSIAAIIGTIMQQNKAEPDYINQFGPFWAEVFLALKLNAVYSAWWFLLILAFLVISTSLCIARNAPKFIADMRTYKENIREGSLKAFHHKAQGDFPQAPAAEAQRIGQLLATGGWKVRLQERDTPAGKGWMVAAKAGTANKIGYIAAHSAIVLVCVGGLLDGDLIVRAQMLLGGKSVYTGGGLIADVKPEHRLSERNPTFRGNLLVAEGTQSSTAILSQSDGVLLQDLPFVMRTALSIPLPKLRAARAKLHSSAPQVMGFDALLHDAVGGDGHDLQAEDRKSVV